MGESFEVIVSGHTDTDGLVQMPVKVRVKNMT